MGRSQAGLPAEERRDMRGGADPRRRRILAGALGTALLPRLVFAQAQRDTAKNREIYLYRGADREKRILEGARKEREVVVYTSLNLKDSVPIVEVFERKYGVKVQLWRSSSEKVLQRAVAEARAGRFSCDILETNGPEMEAMHREELLEEFFSPHFKDLPPAAFPRHRHYVADRFNFFTIAYNTNLVKANEVPNTYEDLLNPRFAGRVGLEASDVDWFGAVVKSMGEEKGLAFFRKRAAALCRLHALPRRADDPEGAQSGALEPRRGHPPQQVPLRDDRPGDHARRSGPLGETLVGSFPQMSEDPEGSRMK